MILTQCAMRIAARELRALGTFAPILPQIVVLAVGCCCDTCEIAPEPTGHGLPLGKCEAYNRVYDQFYQSR